MKYLENGSFGSKLYQRAKFKPVDEVETFVKCSFCDKTFACHSQVKNHEIVHSEEKPFVCEICNRGFRRKYDKNRHVQEGFKIIDRVHLVSLR